MMWEGPEEMKYGQSLGSSLGASPLSLGLCPDGLVCGQSLSVDSGQVLSITLLKPLGKPGSCQSQVSFHMGGN